MTGTRVPQGDLFALDSPLLTEIRGERSLMAFPFFALSKGRWTKPLAYKGSLHESEFYVR